MVPTRWNSLLLMVQSFFDQRVVIRSILDERRDRQEEIVQKTKRARLNINVRPAPDDLPNVTKWDFEKMKEICRILKPFEITTLKFCEETSTASILIPSLTKLDQYLKTQSEKITNSDFAKTLASSLSEKLTNRLAKMRTEEILGEFLMI